MNRRQILKSLSTLAIAGAVSPLHSIEPFQRTKTKLKGLGLTTYSMRQHMKWYLGKPAEGSLDMLDFLDYCASLGLEGAEITGYFFPEPLDRQSINAIKHRAHILGMDITGGAMGNSFANPPRSEAGKAQLSYARKWIDRFTDMGAPVVRVFAERGVRAEGLTDEQVIKNVIANLEEVLPYAEKQGIILGLENHDFIENIDYLLEILEAIDSKWLGVIWDSANIAPVADPYAELERIAPFAVTAQVKVMTTVNGEDVPANYARLVNILKQARYRGYLIFEYEEEEDPYTAIPRHLKELRKLI
jgi:sugar phosphate isomerase/epimerase